MALVQQIGSRLVKTFANGRTIVTETVGKGQTLTKVLGSDGKVVVERLKVVSDPVKVGKRNVIHTDRIIKEGPAVYKSAVDRVYNVVDGKNVFAGSREIVHNRKCIMIPTNNAKFSSKVFNTSYFGGIRNFESMQYLDILHRSVFRDTCTYDDVERAFTRDFNSIGLPYPIGLSGIFDEAERAGHIFSLREMREKLQQEFPGRAYTNWPGMKSLDESVLPKSSLFDYLS